MRYVHHQRRWPLGLSKKISSGDIEYVYAAEDNNGVVLIQTTPESIYTLESGISYDDLVDTMGDDMLEAMERGNGQICNDSDSSYCK